MRRVTLRGLFARRTRLALTALAVALGVTLIAGTYVFTDTINRSFDRIFTQTNKGTDASLTPHEAIKQDQGGGGTVPTIPPQVLATVRRQPHVLAAEGSVFDSATVLGRDGKRIGAGGAPNFVGSVADVARFRGFSISKGRLPQTAGEAAIDTATAHKEHWTLGDKVAVQGAAPRKSYTIVGLTKIAGVDSFGGATAVDLVLPEAQRMLGKHGYDEIHVAAKPGTSPQQLKNELRAALPRSLVDVRTGAEQAAKQSSDIRSNLSFLTTFLLAFAVIALFVGAFIIFNTFSITVAQRTRELGLLRTLGASRGQVLRSVLGEGLALGLVGSAVGLGLGMAVAPGLRALFKAVGVDLPSTGNVVLPRTIVVALLVGTVVAVAASLAPAIRATRVAPVEALREGLAPVARRLSRRTSVAGGLLIAIGVALMCLGLFAASGSSAALGFMGPGAGATFIGVALFSPRLVRPLASLVGLPIERTQGIVGRLARENAVRLPGRTAVTAAALMIGVALVTFASIFAAGARETIHNQVTGAFKGAFVVQSTSFDSISAGVMPAVARVDGVGETSVVRSTKARVHGIGDIQVTGIDPRTFGDLYRVNKGAAALRALAPGDAVVSKSWAKSHHLRVGSPLAMLSPDGHVVRARVSGVKDDKGGLTDDVVVPNSVVTSAFGDQKVSVGFVGLASGAAAGPTQHRIKALLARAYPEAKVQTAEQFVADIANQVNKVLGLIYALLSLAIIVSLFGIVNTLVLSISERTRELGMLRAIGATRRQVKRIVRWEAVITALIGAILGLVLGVVLAVLFTRPLNDFTLTIPVGTLVVLVVLAAIAGVGAAVLPARRASRLDVLGALAHE
ncbi:MAG TPA: FtsX-like permease family protein [Solirubrobacteraceae bacterium]|nr:FtsX-like permease family protein [Solirubrobacteraceae bacterium]